MKHILRNVTLLALGACLAGACSKSGGEGVNEAARRYFDAWLAINYPSAVEKDGIYIIDDKPGTGMEWRETLPVTFLTYTMRELNGSVQYNTDENWAKQLGEWSSTTYYGPQITLTGEKISYAGLDAILEGMREGGVRTAIVPSWLMTYDRYDTLDEYLEHESSTSGTIYTIKFLGQTANLAEHEYSQMQAYSVKHWKVSDTLSTAGVFFKSHTEFPSDPVEMPSDTTVYINYIGRRIYDGQVFDTNIADTAKYYGIYYPGKKYEPVSVTWAENATDIKMGSSSVVNGFAYGLHAMHADESASFVFGYNLGYGSSGGTDKDLVPPYAALRFDVDMVPAP
ncbi:MAG: FKBP-type peptidyl-prolyl cis-trans isomerase [Bacteroidales bacterium]|nr:FKBP-type peptidyl-prolyl cis-trans isomerase [Bacteroidales bacterium]